MKTNFDLEYNKDVESVLSLTDIDYQRIFNLLLNSDRDEVSKEVSRELVEKEAKVLCEVRYSYYNNETKYCITNDLNQ